MRDEFPAYYRPSAAEFAAKFKECVFAFDTNILLNLYRYTPESRAIVISILRSIEDRIWLPHQAALEYHRGRIEELLTQAGLADRLGAEIQKAIEGTEKLGRSSVMFTVNRLIEPVQEKLKAIKAELAQKKEKQPDLMEGDSILNDLTTLFAAKVGKPYSKEDYQEIYKAGKERYQKRIPPGYKDKSEKPDDTDQYGDLVIWRQLIDYAKLHNRATVFVTDDAKEDWWLEIRGQRIGPRLELREEFLQETGGKWFYMYSMEQFLNHAKEYLGAAVTAEVIQETEGMEKLDAEKRLEEPPAIIDLRYDLQRARHLILTGTRRVRRLCGELYKNPGSVHNLRALRDGIAKVAASLAPYASVYADVEDVVDILLYDVDISAGQLEPLKRGHTPEALEEFENYINGIDCSLDIVEEKADRLRDSLESDTQ